MKSKTVLNLSICVPNAQSKTSALTDNRFSELTVTRRHVVIRKSVLSESCDKTSLPNCSIPNYYRYRVFQVIHILYSCICKSEMATSSKPRVDTNSLSPVRPILNLPYARGRGTVGMNRHILLSHIPPTVNVTHKIICNAYPSTLLTTPVQFLPKVRV